LFDGTAAVGFNHQNWGPDEMRLHVSVSMKPTSAIDLDVESMLKRRDDMPLRRWTGGGADGVEWSTTQTDEQSRSLVVFLLLHPTVLTHFITDGMESNKQTRCLLDRSGSAEPSQTWRQTSKETKNTGSRQVLLRQPWTGIGRL